MSKKFWVIVLPIILTVIIVPLVALVYNGVCEDIKENKVELEKKVDNKTLQIMIKSMQDVQMVRIEQQKEEQKKTDKRFDQIYKEIKELKKE